MKKVIALSLGDLRNIGRDLILSISLFAPLLLTALLRFVIPVVNQYLLLNFDFNLTPHYPFILSFTLLLTPLLVGTATGFLILEEKDENLLRYFTITPLSKDGYLSYRLLSPMVLSTLLSFVILYFTNLIKINHALTIPIVIMAALEAPLMALILGTFAENKVEGLAISKAMGLFFAAPAVGYFISASWRWMAGIIAPFWVTEAFLHSSAFSLAYIRAIIIGIVLHLVCIFIVYRRFTKSSE